MTHKEKIKNLKDEIILSIKQFLVSKGIKELQFKDSFNVKVIDGDVFEDEYVLTYNAVGISDESVVLNYEYDEKELTFVELDINELAHIIDLLETNQFEILETLN